MMEGRHARLFPPRCPLPWVGEYLPFWGRLGGGKAMLILLLWLPIWAVAQTDRTALEQEAAGYFQQRQYDRALPLYRQLVGLDSTSIPANVALGLCLKQLGKQDESLVPFRRVYRQDSTWNIALHIFLGDAYMFNLQYRQATWHYQQFLNKTTENIDQKELVRTNLRKVRWAATHLADSIRFRPQNLGPAINGPGEDYNAFLTADDSILYYNSHREGCVGGYDPEVFMKYGSDFFVSTGGPGRWSAAQPVAALNTAEHEKEFHLSPDGQQLYYGRHPRSREAGYDCLLLQSERKQGRWQRPQLMPTVLQSGFCDSWPSLSADGRTLYFVSDRPGGFGGFDIWYSQLSPKGWQEPQNLGPKLNTPGDEFDVFIHPDDSTLYFTSDYHEGFGGYDLYLSRRSPKGQWGSPQNLGYPLNTPWDEFDLFINAAGTTGYLNSDRWGGYGMQDLYSFELDPQIRPRSTVYLKGKVYDSTKPDHSPASTVWIIDLGTTDTLRHVPSQDNGEFLLAIPTGKPYAALTLADGYLPDSRHFEPESVYGQHYALTIPLVPISLGAEFTLRNVFFDNDAATLRTASVVELQLLRRLLQQYPTLQLEVQGHTDNNGTADYNLDLSRRRAQAVQDWLMQQGIVVGRLTAAGYGETRPVAPNTTADGRQQNRRVVFRVTGF